MPISAGGLASGSTFVGPVIYQVWVNQVPYSGIPKILDAELWEVYGQHDLFFLRIELPRNVSVNQLNVWADDTPIRIAWGRVPDVQTWYGYVNHHEIKHNADSGTHAQQITYVCIGTSSVLNIDKTRTWQQVSPTYIAKTIAQENGFRAVVTPAGQVLPWEQQNGMSDFEFLNHIANKTGYKFWCSGGTLYFIVPDVSLVSHTSAAAPIFYANKRYESQDTVRDFTMIKGLNVPGTVVANRAIFGIDSVSGLPFAAINQPSKATSRVIVKTDYAASSYAEAKSRIDAEAALSQYWIAAKAQLFGNTTVYPGKVVNIQGMATPDNIAGNWLVTSAKHKMLNSGTTSTTQDKYVVDVELMRNTDTGDVDLGYTQPIVPEFTQCSLIPAGTWTSSTPGVVTQSVT